MSILNLAMNETSNKYLLKPKDYVDLYPIVSPSEIQEEFGARSKTARTINRLYNKIGLPSSRDGLEAFIEESYSIADLEVNQNEWLDYVMEQIAYERNKKINRLWDRIRKIEELLVEDDYTC